MQLIYLEEKHNFKAEAFVNGIRDTDIKLAVYPTQKTTFADTVAFVLAQQTAPTIYAPQVSKVRRTKVVGAKECLLYKSKKMLKQILEKGAHKVKLNV